MAGPPAVAYVVLSHTDPPHVRRLVDRLVRGDERCVVIVDHDPAGPPLGDLGGLARHARVRLLATRRAGGWGGFGLVGATLSALRHEREHVAAEWVVLLSGQDYPVAPPAATRDGLLAADADAFLDTWRVVRPDPGSPAERWWHARYFFRWWALPSPPGPPRAPAAAARVGHGLARRLSLSQPFVFVWSLPRGQGTRVGVRRRRVPFSPAWPCRAGSQWFALSRRAADAVCDLAERRPAVVEHYRHTIIPDESFFVTVVGNDPSLRVAEPNLTYARFDDGVHAAQLGPADLEAVLASGRAFARKTGSASGSLLDALDARAGL